MVVMQFAASSLAFYSTGVYDREHMRIIWVVRFLGQRENSLEFVLLTYRCGVRPCAFVFVLPFTIMLLSLGNFLVRVDIV